MSDHEQHFVSLRNARKPKPSINSSRPGQRRDEAKDIPESWRVFLDRLQKTLQLGEVDDGRPEREGMPRNHRTVTGNL